MAPARIGDRNIAKRAVYLRPGRGVVGPCEEIRPVRAHFWCSTQTTGDPFSPPSLSIRDVAGLTAPKAIERRHQEAARENRVLVADVLLGGRVRGLELGAPEPGV